MRRIFKPISSLFTKTKPTSLVKPLNKRYYYPNNQKKKDDEDYQKFKWFFLGSTFTGGVYGCYKSYQHYKKNSRFDPYFTSFAIAGSLVSSSTLPWIIIWMDGWMFVWWFGVSFVWYKIINSRFRTP